MALVSVTGRTRLGIHDATLDFLLPLVIKEQQKQVLFLNKRAFVLSLISLLRLRDVHY